MSSATDNAGSSADGVVSGQDVPQTPAYLSQLERFRHDPRAPAPWHLTSQGQLRAGVHKALEQTCARAPDLRALAEWIVPRLPIEMQWSSTLKTDNPSSQFAHLVYVFAKPWLSFNDERQTCVIIVDCDHTDLEGVLATFEKHRIPPTWATVGSTERFHLAWWLTSPVMTGDKAHEGPKRLLKFAQALLCAAARGDTSYQNRLTKNPFGTSSPYVDPTSLKWYSVVELRRGLCWRTSVHHPEPYQLGAIVDALKPEFGGQTPPRWKRSIRLSESFSSRNMEVFRCLRLWAMITKEDGAAAILDKAISLNQSLPDPMPSKEVESIARSVTKWMKKGEWRKRSANAAKRVRQGPMHLAETELALKEKRNQAGKHGAAQNARSTNVTLVAALSELRAEHKKVTRTLLAARAGVSLPTLRKRWQALMDGTLAVDSRASTSPVQNPARTANDDPSQLFDAAD